MEMINRRTMSRLLRRLPGRRPRALKVVQNFLFDLPPRNSRLVLEEVSTEGAEITLTFSDRGRTIVHNVRFEKWTAEVPLQSVVDEHIGTALGLVLAPHMFAITDFEAVVVKTGGLNAEQRRFWEWYLQHGLGEFRYCSGLDPRRPIEVIAPDPGRTSTPHSRTRPIHRAILLNGGGKDTAVAAELCRRTGITFDWLTITPTEARASLITVSNRPSAFEATVHLDKTLPTLMRYRPGHVPYFAVFAVAGLIAALGGGYDAVIAGNERSADEGNLLYKGFEVNHQASKSSTFEIGFQKHVVDPIGSGTLVFSILRPFSEIHLAQLFTKLDEYRPICISCNRGIRAGRWCLNCPKCGFVTLAYAAFLDDPSLEAIFGELPFNRLSVRREWVPLVSGSIKPWECVGTQEECKLALQLFLDRRPNLQLTGRPDVAALRKLLAGFDGNQAAARLLSASRVAGTMPAGLGSAVLDAAEAIARGELDRQEA